MLRASNDNVLSYGIIIVQVNLQDRSTGPEIFSHSAQLLSRPLSWAFKHHLARSDGLLVRAPRTPLGGGRGAAGLPQVDGILAGRPQTWVHLGVMRPHRPWRPPTLQWPAGTGGSSRRSLVAARALKGSALSWPNGCLPPFLDVVRRRHMVSDRCFGRAWNSEGENCDFAHLSPSPYKTATLPAHMSRVPLSHRRSVHPHRRASMEVGHRAARVSARAGASRPPSSSRAPATSPRCPRAGRKPRARDRLALSPCDMRLHTCFAHAFAVALLRSGGASRASRRVNHLTLVSLTAAVL